MQVEVDPKCMQTNFGGRDLSGFRDLSPFSFAFKTAKFPFGPWAIKKGTEPWAIVHGGQKIESAQ